jgi:two-component system sensor histidine kinase CpxA
MPVFRLSLLTKIMLWFFLNLILLAIALWLVFSFSFRFDASFFSGISNKMDSISRVITEEVNGKTRAEIDEILKRYTDTYEVEFFLFDNRGEQLGGREISLPTEVLNEILYPESGPKAPGNSYGKDGPPALNRPPRPGRSMLSIFVKTTDPTLYWSGARTMISEPGNPEPVRVRILAVSDSVSGNGLFFDPTPWLIVAAIIFGGSTLFWLPFVKSITNAIGQMSAATAKIADEDFDVQVDENRTDELGKLGAGINHLARRLSDFVTGQKRFLGDISHELNSPLARMQFALTILEDRVREENRVYVEDVKEEVEIMSKLVGELLSYSKAGIKATRIELEKIHLRTLVEQVVERENGAGSADIEIEISDDTLVLAHFDLLSRAIGNLVRNAVRYAGHAGTILISAEDINGTVKIIISDQGAGVPDSALEKLFAPFYRIQSDRSRESGGTGLGLAIVKTCIEACRGKVFASNRVPSGLEITIILQK